MPKKKSLKIKIAVMGGSFNPFHFAHLNSLLTVREQFALDNIIVVPSFKTPLQTESAASPIHRLEMLQNLFSFYPFITVDDQEIRRKGISYTHRTITQLFKKRNQEELFFIMGLDQFLIFDRWKNFKEILKKTNLIVTSRPGNIFSNKRTADFPKGIKTSYQKKIIKGDLFKNFRKKNLFLCNLKDMDISSSYIRERIKEKKEVDHLLPKTVDLYIKDHQLYTS